MDAGASGADARAPLAGRRFSAWGEALPTAFTPAGGGGDGSLRPGSAASGGAGAAAFAGFGFAAFVGLGFVTLAFVAFAAVAPRPPFAVGTALFRVDSAPSPAARTFLFVAMASSGIRK